MKLKEYLEKNKIKQKDFARMLGMAYTHIHYIVNEKRYPPIELAKRISDFTNNEVEIEELFCGPRKKCCPTCGQFVRKNSWFKSIS